MYTYTKKYQNLKEETCKDPSRIQGGKVWTGNRQWPIWNGSNGGYEGQGGRGGRGGRYVILVAECDDGLLGYSDQGLNSGVMITELMVDSSPTIYEDERARNIAENKALLAGLGL